ncbi:MAG: MBOAT family protein, partial [Planctomycetes bacterium]|nr:MBOAT family protein [Planctomycetota bacterium]
MIFSSLPFLIFILIVMLAWDRVRGRSMPRWIFLCAASMVFYSWWDWRFLFLLLGSGTIDFIAALGMERWPRRRRLLLIASLVANIGSLVFFKYVSFAAWELRTLLGISDAGWGWTNSIVLPIGISFYTFQSMSYTIDVFRGDARTIRNPIDYWCYVAMFPQL